MVCKLCEYLSDITVMCNLPLLKATCAYNACTVIPWHTYSPFPSLSQPRLGPNMKLEDVHRYNVQIQSYATLNSLYSFTQNCLAAQITFTAHTLTITHVHYYSTHALCVYYCCLCMMSISMCWILRWMNSLKSVCTHVTVLGCSTQ